MAYYRFLRNPDVSLTTLINSLKAHCCEQLEGRQILAISDSSEINLQAHVGRLQPEGQGVVGNNRDIGFFIHPTMVVDRNSGLPLGLSTVQLWTRPAERASKAERDYQSLPIEEKESYKWIQSAKDSQDCFAFSDVNEVTYVGDSESDIYEPWFQIPEPKVHLLVRACKDRRIMESDSRLFAYLDTQPIAGTYELDIPGDLRTNRSARRATLAVRFTQVTLKQPKRMKQDYPEQVQLNAVDVIESYPPEDEEAIHWRLLTTHEVSSYEQARMLIQWYCWRWHIEQLFAILKQRCLDIEATQLESVAAIQKLCTLALSVALTVLQLTLGRENQDETADIAFNRDKQTCLGNLAPTLEGRTTKQKNPYSPGSLAWATWLIARLGGWSGYRSQRPPGFATIYRGLQQFDSMFMGWQLAHP
ncbi:MAG: IS4 family transposase [Cyanobacteria bacterium J06649_4]